MAKQQPTPTSLQVYSQPVSTFTYDPVIQEAEQATPIPQEVAGESGPGAYGQDVYEGIQKLIGTAGDVAAKAINVKTQEENRQQALEGQAKRWQLQKSYAKAWADGDITADMNPYFLIAYEEADAELAYNQFVGNFEAERLRLIASGDSGILLPDGYDNLWDRMQSDFLTEYHGSDAANATMMESPYWGNTFNGSLVKWRAKNEGRAQTQAMNARLERIYETEKLNIIGSLGQLASDVRALRRQPDVLEEFGFQGLSPEDAVEKRTSEFKAELKARIQRLPNIVWNQVAYETILDGAMEAILSAPDEDVEFLLDFVENDLAYGHPSIGDGHLLSEWKRKDADHPYWQTLVTKNERRLQEKIVRHKNQFDIDDNTERRDFLRELVAENLPIEIAEKRIAEWLGSRVEDAGPLFEPTLSKYKEEKRRMDGENDQRSMTDQSRIIRNHAEEAVKNAVIDMGASLADTVTVFDESRRLGRPIASDPSSKKPIMMAADPLSLVPLRYVHDGEVHKATYRYQETNGKKEAVISFGPQDDPHGPDLVLNLEDLWSEAHARNINKELQRKTEESGQPVDGRAMLIHMIDYQNRHGYAHPRLSGSAEEWLVGKSDAWYLENRHDMNLQAEAEDLLTAYKHSVEGGMDLSVWGDRRIQDQLRAALNFAKGNLGGDGSIAALQRVTSSGMREQLQSIYDTSDYYTMQMQIRGGQGHPFTSVPPRFRDLANQWLERELMDIVLKEKMVVPLTTRDAQGSVLWPGGSAGPNEANVKLVVEELQRRWNSQDLTLNIGGETVWREWLLPRAMWVGTEEIGTSGTPLSVGVDLTTALEAAKEMFVENPFVQVEGQNDRRFRDIFGVGNIPNPAEWTIQILDPAATKFVFRNAFDGQSRIFPREALVDIMLSRQQETIERLQDLKKDVPTYEDRVSGRGVGF